LLQTMILSNLDFLPGHQEGVREVMMPMAPLFHGNGWNMPFTAPAVEFLDEFPMTGTGKVQKLMLRERFRSYKLS